MTTDIFIIITTTKITLCNCTRQTSTHGQLNENALSMSTYGPTLWVRNKIDHLRIGWNNTIHAVPPSPSGVTWKKGHHGFIPKISYTITRTRGVKNRTNELIIIFLGTIRSPPRNHRRSFVNNTFSLYALRTRNAFDKNDLRRHTNARSSIMLV